MMVGVRNILYEILIIHATINNYSTCKHQINIQYDLDSMKALDNIKDSFKHDNSF